MKDRARIGFGQRIRLEWLERTALLQRAGKPKREILEDLQGLLAGQVSVGNPSRYSSRGKTLSILLGVWVSVPRGMESFRDEGLEHLAQLPPGDRLAVHWGMCMAAYPFFGSVAETVGRLLRLQESATAGQVQRRMREQLGERKNVAIATQRVLRSFVDWGVLRDGGTTGRYESAPARPVGHRGVAAWLVEAVLVSSGGDSGRLAALAGSPALFPFELGVASPARLNGNRRLEFLRQGLDEDVVMLRAEAAPSAGMARG